MAGQAEAESEVYDGGRAEACLSVRLLWLAGWLWRIDLALSGSRGQSVEAVGNAMHVYMYKAEVTGRAGHGREVGGIWRRQQ